MSSIKLNSYNQENPFDISIKNGSIYFGSDPTYKATSVFLLGSQTIANDLGEDTEVLGGEILMDQSFFPNFEQFKNTDFFESIDLIKEEAQSGLEYVGIIDFAINLAKNQNSLTIEVTPTGSDTVTINL